MTNTELVKVFADLQPIKKVARAHKNPLAKIFSGMLLDVQGGALLIQELETNPRSVDLDLLFTLENFCDRVNRATRFLVRSGFHDEGCEVLWDACVIVEERLKGYLRSVQEMLEPGTEAATFEAWKNA